MITVHYITDIYVILQTYQFEDAVYFFAYLQLRSLTKFKTKQLTMYFFLCFLMRRHHVHIIYKTLHYELYVIYLKIP